MKTTTESWWAIWETFVQLSFWQGFYPIPTLLHLTTLSSNHINIIWQSGLATWSLESGRLLFPVRPKIHQLEHLPLWRILVVSVLDAPQGSVTKFRIYIYRWIMGLFSYLTPLRGRKARSHCCSGNNVFLLDKGNIICIQTYIYIHTLDMGNVWLPQWLHTPLFVDTGPGLILFGWASPKLESQYQQKCG